MSNIRKDISELYDDQDLLFLDENCYDDAILGICEQFGKDNKIAYDGEKVIKILMDNSDMDELEAREYFDYNIIGSYVGEKTPVFVWITK